MVVPLSVNPEKTNVDILCLEEGEIREGRWRVRRRLNGDEAVSMWYDRPTLLRIKFFSYQ